MFNRRSTALTGVLALIVMFTLFAGVQLAGATGPSWHVVPNPAEGYHNSDLAAISGTANNLIAVGSKSNLLSVAETLIEHWDGNTWSVMPSPNYSDPQSSSGGDVLLGVYGAVPTPSPADYCRNTAWAVGKYDTPNAGSGSPLRPLLLQLSSCGLTWNMASLPIPTSYVAVLNAVAGDSAGNVWAVGYYNVPGASQRTLVLKYSGGVWTWVASPNVRPSTDINTLTSISIDNTGIGFYTVGYWRDNTGNPVSGMILHWNGNSWDPITEVAGKVTAVAASNSSSGQARAVGERSTGGQLFGVRRSNTGWRVDEPQVTGETGLYSVSYVPGSTGSFSVGRSCSGSYGPCSSLAFYNNGQVDLNGNTKWIDLDSAAGDPPGGFTSLAGVKALSETDVWVVGLYRTELNGHNRALIMRYGY